MALIVGLGHQKRTGKDQFVKFCIDILRQSELSKSRIIRRGFADKLYDCCYMMYSWAGFHPRLHYEQHPNAKDEILPALNKTPRDILIEVGNKMREYDIQVWVNANVKDAVFDIMFVSDVRYPNEFEGIEKAGGVLIRMTRPGLPEPTDIADTSLTGKYTSRWHHTVDNSGDLHDLQNQAVILVDKLIIPRYRSSK